MATIRCTDVADSAQVRLWRSFAIVARKQLRCFVARAVVEGQATLLGKAAVKEPWTPNAALTTKRSMRFCSSPGMTRSFFFVPLKKEWSATNEGKRWGCGCSVDACGGSIINWIRKTTAYALFHCMDQRVAPPKCLWQMPVALQSEAAPRLQTVSADETDVEVVMSVSGAMRALVLFCNAVGVKPSPFVTEDFVGKASVTTTLTTVARRLTLCCDRSKKRHFESALAFKAPAFVHTWSATTKQTVNSWAQSTVTSQTDGDWCAVCGEDNGIACWEPNSCSCYTWQSPTNCHSTFAHW